MLRHWRELSATFLRGMAMGAADVVPGVSGGTIAFISGIYQRLINALGRIGLHAWAVWRTQGFAALWRYVDGGFLLTLFAGIATSVVSLAGIIKYLLTHQPVLIMAFFFGLVAASVWVLRQDVSRWTPKLLTIAAIGAALAVSIALLPKMQGTPSLWFLFFAGALAICAMILPGISGAFILLILGAYEPILTAVHERNLLLIAVVGAGAICGLLSFTHVLKWLFAHFYQPMIALLTGFVAGSLFLLWPWKDAAGDNLAPWAYAGDASIIVVLLCLCVGGVLVLILSHLGREKALS
ncbi:DUF368 domain-containing protein [Suttonella sp. R2A3]|uniref:DUF368 domain-containing protein n=1 Tax=Suttonella sp. R2A3 TaxID=2908648 RepID=UPI001F3C569D|nr:DUF368 domain-containing protein [Suttonella sp. R2A3]UJF23901.1 DUF368 domain-containing protein [Suttonella sp. R2A3]